MGEETASGETAVRRNTAGRFEYQGEDHALWLRVQHDYEHKIGTVAQICQTHGVTEQQLRYRIRKRKWKLREARSEDSRQRLIDRLLLLLGRQIGRLELRMNADEKVPPTPEELSTVSNSMARLTGTLEKLAAMTKGDVRTYRESEAMLELRAKIARRIEQLNQG